MKKKRIRRTFDTKEKINAVLSIWTECQTATQVCKQLSISWTLLERWQNQAMEGMLEALSPSRKEQETALNTRLARLVDKKMNGSSTKLEKRLKKIQAKEKTA